LDAIEGTTVRGSILDAAGKLISNNIVNTTLKQNINEFTIPIKDIPVGVYMVRLEVGNKVFNQKMMILR
jgi:LEA14-like dessication related protein